MRIAGVVMEKFDAERLKAQMVKNGMNFTRIKSKIVKVFGQYYYKELKGDEIEKAKE